jgi:small subunit ribosomal protein S3
LKPRLYASGVSKIEIERTAGKIKLNIHVAKPGMVIGKGGAGIEELRKTLEKLTNNKSVAINITEIKVPEMDAQLVAENIAAQLEKLREEDKIHTVKFKQLLAEKLTVGNILTLFRTYGLY